MTAASWTARHVADQRLDLDRRHPLAAGLDDVFDAVDDLHEAVRRHDRDVLRVQVAACPQLLGGLRLLEVALRQRRARAATISPWRLAVARHVAHLFVDDAQVDEAAPDARSSERHAHVVVGISRGDAAAESARA